MNPPETYSFSRYLAAKKTIDDRSLNPGVLERLRVELAHLRHRNRPVRVLEAGCGIGTMIERLLDGGLLDGADYTAIDADAELTAEARRRLPQWALRHRCNYRWQTADDLILSASGGDTTIRFRTADIHEFCRTGHGHDRWDLLVAHAFMDLVDYRQVTARVLPLMHRRGLLCLTLNFDGETVFLPSVDPPLDARIIDLYHQSMNQRTVVGKPSGDSRTGRHLLWHLMERGFAVLSAGSSDWVVLSGAGEDSPDSAYFLHFIVHTVDAQLDGHPELDRSRFREWIRRRHAQIDAGMLLFIAKQLDYLVRVPASDGPDRVTKDRI
jgi:SAM-dependent methyltransferase